MQINLTITKDEIAKILAQYINDNSTIQNVEIAASDINFTFNGVPSNMIAKTFTGASIAVNVADPGVVKPVMRLLDEQQALSTDPRQSLLRKVGSELQSDFDSFGVRAWVSVAADSLIVSSEKKISGSLVNAIKLTNTYNGVPVTFEVTGVIKPAEKRKPAKRIRPAKIRKTAKKPPVLGIPDSLCHSNDGHED